MAGADTPITESSWDSWVSLGTWAELEGQLLGFRPLTSKLHPPATGVRPVDRRGLVTSLLDTDAPLVLMSAPAGSGKTIALRQWATAAAMPAAWLSCDAGDNDPRVFLTYLILALQSVAELDPLILELLRLSDPPVSEQVLPALAASLAGADPFLLVLDDAHLVEAPVCWRYVHFVLDHLPAGAQLALGSRTRPPLALGRLRADGRLAEVGPAQLAMTGEETAELGAHLGLEPGTDAITSMLERTEGWATGVYLALLLWRDRPPQEWLSRVRGAQLEIAEYLSDEVLDRQPLDTQRFLERLSVLTSFCGPLAAEVAARPDAAALLERLVREDLFVVSLDDRDGWYRFHHLFRELLADRLARHAPAEVGQLHRRAALWHQDHGYVEEAVSHWVACGEAGEAAQLAAAACDVYVDHGRGESGRLLLERFSDAQLLAQPQLTLAAGWVYGILPGEPQRMRWIRAACQAAADDRPGPNGATSLRSWQLAIRVLHAPYGITAMLKDAEAEVQLEQGAGPDWRLLAQLDLGMAQYVAGRRAAERTLRAVADDPSYPESQIHALGYLSLLKGDEGRQDEAAQTLEEAERLVRSVPFLVCPCKYLPLRLARARVAAQRSEPETQALAADAASALRRMSLQDDWILLLGLVTLGEIHLGLGDVAQASACAAEASTILARYPDADMLAPRLRQLRRLLEERLFAEPLTEAELRVLQLMPTQLTMQQLAQRLFLSLNTIRSHSRAIYRKLGVHDRTAAVERARELGLL